jgi:hypothetical protein
LEEQTQAASPPKAFPPSPKPGPFTRTESAIRAGEH